VAEHAGEPVGSLGGEAGGDVVDVSLDGSVMQLCRSRLDPSPEHGSVPHVDLRRELGSERGEVLDGDGWQCPSVGRRGRDSEFGPC
jgi:hypothetical protein